jgi:hypothetical protein
MSSPTRWVGIDLHRRRSQVAIINDDRNVCASASRTNPSRRTPIGEWERAAPKARLARLVHTRGHAECREFLCDLAAHEQSDAPYESPSSCAERNTRRAVGPLLTLALLADR